MTVSKMLGKIGINSEKSISRLIKCLKDDEIEVRISALQALGMLGKSDDRNVLDALNEIIVDKDQLPDVKSEAREALGKMKGKIPD